MREVINNQLECKDCTFCQKLLIEDDHKAYWCSFWGFSEDEAPVDPDGYCNNAIKKRDKEDGEID